MSSEERGMATSAQPSWPGVSGWESIFAAMVEVPSLDSDEGSLSEGGDDELQIFQRDDICFMTDLSEELLDKEGNEEIPNEDVAEGFRKETLSIVTSPLHGRDEFTSGTPTDELKSPVENNGKPYRELHLPARNTLCKEDRGHDDPGFELPDGKDGNFSSLNKKQVAEHWDPDHVFQKLIEMGTDHVLPDMDLERTWDPELPPPPLPLFESYSARRQEEIMKQLADLNARQSQAVPGSWRLAPETEGHVRGGESSSRTSFPQKDLDVTGGKRCHQQTPTVYIDLRTATSSADATSLGHQRSGAFTRVNRKADKTLPNTSTLTGKSLLLHQLRHMKNIPAPETPETKPQKMASAGGNAADPSPASQTQRKGRRESTSKDAPSVLEKPEAREVNRGVTAEERTREETRLDLNLHPSPTKLQEPPCSEDLEHKEKEEKQKQDRRRMQIQLEKLKPLRSVNTHQPMAEATPVLFHPDVSYGPDVRTLPAASCSIAEMVLLTVRLTSSGQVIVPGYHGCRSPDSTRFSVNAYNSLLTWLLSLVLPLNPHRAAGAPFQVLGLQQVWLEEGLALFACLSPQDMSMQSSPKIRKLKGKGDLRGTSTFYQETLLYLKQNTLQSVTWWADEVAQRVEGQLFPLRMEIPPVKLSKIVSLNPALEAVERAFSPSSGFYWQTLETEEKLSPLDLESDAGDETQVVSVTLFDSLLRDPVSFHHVLHLILTKGLDVCGLRLLYSEAGIPCACTEPLPPSYTQRDAPAPPVLALALRGCRAGEAWGDLSGPCDPQLARMTDPYSVHALYGSRRDDPILQVAQGSARLVRGLSLWFGGRISDSGGNVNIGIQNPAERRAETCRPPALLTGTVMGDVFLVVSPAVPPMAYGDIIDVCRGRGFTMLGVRRRLLTARHVSILSMSPKQVPIYCPCKPSAQLMTQPCPRAHSLLLLLRKENAGRHVPGLLCGLMNGLAEQGLLGPIRTHFSQPSELDTDMCFHAAPYSDGLMQSLGGSLYAVPDPMSATMDMLTARPLPSDPENEQVVILTMTGRQTLKRAGHLLRQILRPCQKSSNGYDLHRYELLGLKWLPSLSRPQAKEITPYEVGDRPWQKSVTQLTSNPALLCALRCVRAFVTLERVIRDLAPNTDKRPPQLIMSATPEIAFRQAALIFTDKELISDPESRHMLKYIAPLSVTHKHGGGGGHEKQTESLFSYMLSGPPLLYTVLLLKPGIWSHNIGKILRKMEFQKFHLVGMKAVALTPMDCGLILPDNVTQDGLLFHGHREYLISGPSLVLCLQRHNAVLKLLDLLGPEDPQMCKAEDQFLWRAQYGTSIVRNGMYGSTSYSNALRDLKHFFPEGLPCQDSIVLESEQIPKLTRDVLFDSRAWRRATRNPLHQPGRTPAMDGSFISALGQTTCLVFPPCTMHGSPPHYIHGVEQLTGRDFRVTGARLTVFDHFQAQYVADLYNPTDGLSAELKALMDGPCLLIAAQRDNAVSCFNSLMESIIWQNSPNQSFPPEVLRPKTETQANKMITGFFDSLTPDSIHQIVHQTT